MSDATNPSYYKLPGGHEAIQVTRHLTGNGAQAAQYIIRATRTDGKIKGDPIEDLNKAIWFIRDEIDRLSDEALLAEPVRVIGDTGGDSLTGEIKGFDKPCSACNGSGSRAVEVYNITVDAAKDIASDGLDAREVADEVSRSLSNAFSLNRDARYLGGYA